MGVGMQIRNQGAVKWVRQHDMCYEKAYDFKQGLYKLHDASKSAEELNFRELA